jgi:hypothetical protein
MASVSKLQSSANILPPGTFRLSIPTGEMSVEISAQCTAGELETAIHSISDVMDAVIVSDAENGSSYRAWDVIFTSMKYVTNVPFVRVASFSNGTSLKSVTASIQSTGASIPIYDLHSNSSTNETLKMYWQNSSLGVFQTNFTEVEITNKLIASGFFAYAKVEKSVVQGFRHTFFVLVPKSFFASGFNLDIFNNNLLSYNIIPRAQQYSVPLLVPQSPVQSLNDTVSFTLRDPACTENNGGVHCDDFSEELSPPITLPMSAHAFAQNLETLRDIGSVNVSFSSLNGLQNDNGEFVLQGVKYSITFIELTVNSSGTAVTSSNEFTWSPIRNLIKFEGTTQRVFEIPPLSVVPYTSSGSGRRLAASSYGSSLSSSGWISSIKVTKKGGPAPNSNNVSVEVSMNGQDFSASGI